LSVTDVGGLILAVIAFNLAAALTPTKGTFVPDEEELSSRPAGALQVCTYPLHAGCAVSTVHRCRTHAYADDHGECNALAGSGDPHSSQLYTPQDASVSLINPKKFFGVKGFGFTKANELVGCAQLAHDPPCPLLCCSPHRLGHTR
jgi:hypothetical protein